VPCRPGRFLFLRRVPAGKSAFIRHGLTLASAAVPPPKKKNALTLLRWLLLMAIPAVWCVFYHYGKLDLMENRTVDLRFRARGEIDAVVMSKLNALNFQTWRPASL